MVAMAAGAGVPHENIAQGMDIARGTLEKHFAQELHAGACKKRLEIVSAMFTAAKKGNVAAQKAYLATPPTPSTPPPAKEPKAPVRGKKEQQQDDAAGAAVGTDWNELLPPAAVH